MKKIIVAAASCAITAFTSEAALVSSFSDIQMWAGDGASATNRAALVIQWNIEATSYSYAWGFGWNSVAPTGEEMLNAIDLVDTKLEIAYHPIFGTLFGIFYDTNQNGSTYTAGTPGVTDPVWGNPPLVPDTAGSTTDPADVYQSGWANGFWGYSISGGDFSYPLWGGGNAAYSSPGSRTYYFDPPTDPGVAWDVSPAGAAGRTLINGSWDSWSFSTDVNYFTFPSTVQPLSAAVPEPSVLLLIGFAVGFHIYARKRLHAR